MNKEQLSEFLISSAETGNLYHAYIIEGGQDSRKDIIAESFAKAITPYHEDIVWVEADDLSVKSEMIETVQQRLALKPLVGDRTVVVVRDADTMTHYAQNRFLKTLEEPSGQAVIILLSENIENLLPTIRSRCRIYCLHEKEQIMPSEEAEQLAGLIGSMLLFGISFYKITRELNWVLSDRSQALAFLDALEIWVYNRILEYADNMEKNQDKSAFNIEHAYRIIGYIEEARRDLNSNINTGYTIKSLILKSI